MSSQENIGAGKHLSRRGFLKVSAATAAATALAGFSDVETAMAETAATEPITEGVWKPMYCRMHCEGTCRLRAYVVDGIPVRLGTDPEIEDSLEDPRHRACGCGRLRLYDDYGTTRLKYPMKRKHWQPGGGEKAHGELRGEDEWERISWDEALDHVANELQRIKDEYGNRAILGQHASMTHWVIGTDIPPDNNGYGWAFHNVLTAFGGYTHAWSTWSGGTSYFSIMNYGGSYNGGNDRFDSQKCDYALIFGSNNAVTGAGSQTHSVLRPMAKAGVKFYFVDPMYNETCAALGGTWVPVRPGQDKALVLGMAYVMLGEDDPQANPVIDWEFLNSHTIGFDADHMPEGVDPKENVKDYILGTYDGVPKTPEWAANLCGTPVEQIYELAHMCAKDNKTAILASAGPTRYNDTDVFCQMVVGLGMMGGHVGKSGHMTTIDIGQSQFMGTPLIMRGTNPLPKTENPVDDCFNHVEMWKSILDKRYPYTGDREYAPVEWRDIDIKCIYNFSGNSLNTTHDMANAVKAYRSMDFVVTHQYSFTDTARYSDIVLPCTTCYETYPSMRVTGEHACLGVKLSDPPYEAKSYFWIGEQLLNRWGIDPKFAFPISEGRMYYEILKGATVMKEDATGYEPLISFTAEEASQFDPDAEPQREGRISFSDLAKTGYFSVKRNSGDVYTNYGGNAAFADDPEANPLFTMSGKFEFYSTTAAMLSHQMGYGDVPPIPKYYPSKNGYESTFSDFDAGVKNDTPYLLFNPHYQRSKHSTIDNIAYMREAFSRPVFINAQDAAEKGISDGDAVRIYNENGSVLRHAYVTNRLIPGAVGLTHGATIMVDKNTGYNVSGSVNWLTYPETSGQGVSGYNSSRCNIEKYEGELPADVDVVDPTPDFQAFDTREA